MCDYSLEKGRCWKKLAEPTTRDFGTGTRGLLAAPEDAGVAVCVFPQRS